MDVRTTLKVTAAAVAVILVALLLWATANVLLLLFTGILLAVLLNGLAGLLVQWPGIPYSRSLAAVLLLTAIIAGLGWFLVPSITKQVSELSQRIPESLERVQEYLSRFGLTKDIRDELPAAARMFTGVFSSTIGALASAFLILFLGIFLAADPEVYRRGFLALIPETGRRQADGLLHELRETLWWWLIAQFGAMAVVGILTWIGLAVLGVPLSLTLALFAMLLTFIPNVGPVAAAIPAILLALLDGPSAALWVAALYIAIQTVESYLITPMLQQRAIELPPALIIAAQVMMGVLAGIPGLLVATPLTAVIVVLVRRLYVEKPRP